MKSFKAIAILFTIVFSTVYYGCKKDATSDPQPIVPTVVPDNTICDGNLKSTFYPIDSFTRWTYNYKLAGVTQSSVPFIISVDSATFGSFKYAMLVDTTSLLDTTVTYLRQDTTTFDILNYNVGTSQDYLEVPASPTIGQYWSIPGSLTKKVTNLSADLHTDHCWYTNLLEISVFRGNTVIFKYYYKRGFGLVDRIDPINLKEFAISDVHFR